MAKYHINSKGEPGVCKAEQGNCPFGGESDHFSSAEEARQAFEASQSSFAVVIKKEADSSPGTREVHSHDPMLDAWVQVAQQEFDSAEDKQDWIGEKVTKLEKTQRALAQTLPGTLERQTALTNRDEARTQLLAADLVNWKSSPFYNESTEARMRETAVVISDADAALETALSNEQEHKRLASELGLAPSDVTRILELTQEEYQRPRAPRSRPLAEVAEDPQYASYTAHVFRIPEENVQEVLRFAAKNSSITAEPEPQWETVDPFAEV